MGLGLNEGYARSTKGLLKIFVIITTIVAFAVFLSKYSGDSDKGGFFVAVHIAGLVTALVIFLVFLITLENTLGSARCWSILNLIASVILGILCIVSSGLLTEHANKHTGHLIAAIVFGFISGVLFLIDALIHFNELR